MSHAAGDDGREHARTSYRIHAIGKPAPAPPGLNLITKLGVTRHRRLDGMLPRMGSAKTPLFGNGDVEAGRPSLYPKDLTPYQGASPDGPLGVVAV